MREAAIVKIITKYECDIDVIIKSLKKSLPVATTSGIIFDDKTRKYHQFVSVNCNE